MSTYKENTDSKPKSSNEIFIRKKPLMTYVIATLVQLANGATVFIKACGKSTPMAVDVAQIIVKRMNALDYKLASVKIGSEAVKSPDGNTRNFSTIEVSVSRYLLNCFIFKLS
jgi:DNA-binding protein